MTWFGWVMLAIEALGAISVAADVKGEKTPRERAIATALFMLMAAGILFVGTGSVF